MSKNILQYESKIWATADLLIGAGIKQSDFPKYMMPYFALMMLESRLLRHYKETLKDFGADTIDDIGNVKDFYEEFNDSKIGYNEIIVKNQKTLAEICKNDTTFKNDFDAYLSDFDIDTKELLGVERANTEEKFLDISGISGQLQNKKILFDTVKKWSEIDLTPFNNSEITTLEEHIKRKWADISAETAGEQYTPDDIISLITEIILSKIEDNGEFLTIYDPTCGGGNLLFGVEDRIKESYKRPTKTYGMDMNDSLFALAKIESRFRVDSEIIHGNTLTKISFIEKQFDVIVANPPYGVDWKGYKKDIVNDTTERFHALPSISDGQFLFTQHILSQLHEKGLAVVVHNGSTLFSGDAGSGESNIRKYFFDNDWVEAIVQMPTDEFFNTGIYTYLWIFNKNKSEERKDKVILINGSDFYEPLKKSKGKKRKEMVFDNRKTIVDALSNFENNNHAKVFDKWHFYFNKQAIMLTNIDENGKSLESKLASSKNKQGEEIKGKSIKIKPIKISQESEEGIIEISDFEIKTFDAKKHTSLQTYFNDELKPLINNLDYKEANLKVITDKETYYFDADSESLIQQVVNTKTALGCGKIVIKATYKKATKTKEAYILITTELVPDYQKDYEIIPYAPTETENQQHIAEFMATYITKPFKYIENTIGVEINFNKVFYTPEKLRSLTEITSDLQNLEKELSNLENQLTL
ncbi:N-6 DNA methylase [Tenacibaculum finnmarkense genomovar ulcerans]|uniref:HsdM family class I SAM-dependent methyltransferase n=1 Tax=Tenacibaculum finnmarkense TaxID=2781243 RepID=UPI00187B54C6|nr:N-6 DNA methylase [Tenacibaculum finnmarkense]MBE7633874.1 N-6 DNA methylase [Tenacibaculum finnmarkense genomovar ulcerans]MCG8795495.1 N-6 DNA methylase [Tenacibaculum finnmarkense]MCG8797727.1 N-6 DNA methylase [Tenacibaculum finnmarkense]